jgi:hypothetical protein
MSTREADSADALLLKSALRALQWLGCADADLIDRLGLNVQEVDSGQERIPLSLQNRDAAKQLVQIYRSVYTLVGSDQPQGQTWMGSRNESLSDTPANLLQNPESIRTDRDLS